eukprot:symbB.v1.2.031045.t1/scaffold3436.1/size58694/6
MGYSKQDPLEELLELKELISKQTAARVELHETVARRDRVGLQAILEAEAAKQLLLDVEVVWGQRELTALSAQTEVEPIRSMEEILAEEEEKQRREEQEEANLLASKQKLEAEIDAAWQKVQAAIDADDEKLLVKLLQDFKGILPAEKVEKAQRRQPAMFARAEMRRELSLAMKTPDNTEKLMFVIAAAKRSCLPQAEVYQAEQLLKETMEAKKAASRASIVEESDEAPSEKKEPTSQLEIAVAANDKELIKQALNELKASGKSTRETSMLYAAARGKFG